MSSSSRPGGDERAQQQPYKARKRGKEDPTLSRNQPVPGFVCSRRRPREERERETALRSQTSLTSGSLRGSGREAEEQRREQEKLAEEKRTRKEQRQEERQRRLDDERKKEEEAAKRVEEGEARLRERQREAEERKQAAATREARRRSTLVGIFAVAGDDAGEGSDSEERRRLARVTASRKTLPLPAPLTDGKGVATPGISDKVTDAFCNPLVAQAAGPGVVAEHLKRFMELKRRFRSRELGGPVRSPTKTWRPRGRSRSSSGSSSSRKRRGSRTGGSSAAASRAIKGTRSRSRSRRRPR